MTMAEFTAVVDKRIAWRVLLKMFVVIVSSCVTLFTIALGPVLWVHSNIEANRQNNIRLEEQVKGLTMTVGTLQLQFATAVSEMKATRNEQINKLDHLTRLIEARAAPPPPRNAVAPIRRATQ